MANIRARHLRNRFLALVPILAVSFAIAGCDGLLEVDTPGDVAAADLTHPSMAPVLVTSAVTDFECAFSDAMLSMGLWSGELRDASTWGSLASQQLRFPTADTGNGTCAEVVFRGAGTTSPYRMLQIARTQGARAVGIIQGQPELANQPRMLATAYAYEAYSTMLIGEFYCETRLDPTGPLVARAAVFQVARERFASARQFAQAAGDNAMLNLARIGGARVAARLGQFAEAKTLAASVPSGFVHNASMAASPVRRNNWVNVYNRGNLMVTVDPDYRNLMVDGKPDPRVQAERRPQLAPNDGVTEIWLVNNYPTAGSPIPLATWREAQLIIAQAEIEAGNGPAAISAINAVRQQHSLPSYAGGTLTEIRNQLIEERRREFFLQSHRLGDMIQFALPFRQGIDHRNRAYTASTCVPLPVAEA